MMNQPPTIEALIPNSERPDSYLVHNETGELPAMPHDPEYRTHEGTLHELARRATGLPLGVDVRQPATNGVMRYQTKPVTPDNIRSPYSWSD